MRGLCVFLSFIIRRMCYKDIFEGWIKSEVLTGRKSKLGQPNGYVRQGC